MAGVNRVILLGNLGKDPELRYTPSGQAVASFSLATNRRYKDREGQSQDLTEWHNIVLWGKQAEIAKDYLKKGSPVYVEGRIQYRNYDDRNGNKRYVTEIVGQMIQLLGKKGDGGAAVEPPADADVAPPATDEDIPF